MAFHREIDPSDSAGAEPVPARHEYREPTRTLPTTTGTLACPRCDAPVSLGGRRATLTEALHCPFCRHGGAVRDFLSLASPSRPARVKVGAELPAPFTRR